MKERRIFDWYRFYSATKISEEKIVRWKTFGVKMLVVLRDETVTAQFATTATIYH